MDFAKPPENTTLVVPTYASITPSNLMPIIPEVQKPQSGPLLSKSVQSSTTNLQNPAISNAHTQPNFVPRPVYSNPSGTVQNSSLGISPPDYDNLSQLFNNSATESQ